MIIEVNKNCVISNDNIAICRTDRLIGLSVTCEDGKEDNGFINYTLAINDNQRCCEEYDVAYSIYSDNKFVKHIVHDAVITDKLKKFIYAKNDKLSDLLKNADVLEACSVAVVYGKNDEIIAIGMCYNVHNGFYQHYVYGNVNNKDIDIAYY